MAKQQIKYTTEEEKRLARNERVRIRRAKQRAAKKAAKKAKAAPKTQARKRLLKYFEAAIPVQAPLPARRKLALLLTNGQITLFLDGQQFGQHDSPAVSATEFAIALQNVGLAFEAETSVVDLRPSE